MDKTIVGKYLENPFCSNVLIDLTCVKRAVSEAIEKATECIYIEDWWLVNSIDRLILSLTNPFLYIDT
jgi:hypothetical protein